MLLISLASIGMLSRHFGSSGQVLQSLLELAKCREVAPLNLSSIYHANVGHILQRITELLSADLTACCTAALRSTRCLLQMQLLLTSTLTTDFRNLMT